MASEIEQLARDFLSTVMAAEPLTATLFGVPGFDDQLPDPSAAGDAEAAARLTEIADRTEAVDPNELSDLDRVTRGVLLSEARSLAAEYADGYKGFTPNGPLSGLGDLFSVLPKSAVSGAESRDNYVARLRALPSLVETVRQRLLEGRAGGATSPLRLIEQSADQLGSYLAMPAADDPFLAPLGDEESFGVVEGALRTAFAALLDTLTRELAPTARDDEHAGIGQLPDGDKIYAHALARHTTTSQSAEEIHALGLGLCERLREEYAQLGQRVFGISSFDAIVEKLRHDPALRYDTAREIVEDARDALRRATDAVPAWFGRVPRTDCVVEVMNELEAPTAVLGYYYPPAGDGSRPGAHWINTHRPELRTRYEYETLAFHESVPGHHLQISLGQEMSADIPEFRRYGYVTAFGEGWALYSERLADEMGLYSSELAKFGMLSFDSWRACRLVVDTGVHHYGWSRQRAIEFMLTNSALTLANIENEVDRYIGWPGQACAYMIGRLEIADLRSRVAAATGAAFDIRAFHDAILANGSVPLAVLREEVSRHFSLT